MNQAGSQNEAPSPMPPSSMRPAVMVWIVGGIQVLLFGCLALILAASMFMPIPDRQQITRDVMLVLLVLVLALGFAPGVSYMVLGFGIRAGNPTSINFALLLLFTQTIVLGTLLLWGVGYAIMQGEPQALTLAVLVPGTPLALLVSTIHGLLTYQRAELANLSKGNDPWNEPQP